MVLSGLFGDDGGGDDIGTIIGAEMWDTDDLDGAIAEAEADGYPPEVIAELKQYRNEVEGYQYEHDIDIVWTDDPDVDAGDVGDPSNLAGNSDLGALFKPGATAVLPDWMVFAAYAFGIGAVLWLLRPVFTVAGGVVSA